MKSNSNINTMIAILAIVVLLISLANLVVTFVKVSEFKEKVTGYATTVKGSVNLTIATSLNINLTTAVINFGSGVVTAPNTNATLTTRASGTATVVNGNWTTTPTALVLANIGNVNCSILLSGTKTAAQFFGGTVSEQMYQWNISNKEADSCLFNETSAQNLFANVNTTAATICNKFEYRTNKNELFIDFRLVVPYDAANTGAQGDEITATCNAQL